MKVAANSFQGKDHQFPALWTQLHCHRGFFHLAPSADAQLTFAVGAETHDQTIEGQAERVSGTTLHQTYSLGQKCHLLEEAAMLVLGPWKRQLSTAVVSTHEQFAL